MSGLSDLRFEYSLEDLPTLVEAYESVSGEAKQILNQIVHSYNNVSLQWLRNLPRRFRDEFDCLYDNNLLDRTEQDDPRVPHDLIFLPDGPGRRWDQLSGLLHRLPEDCVRQWLGTATDIDPETLETKLVYRRLASKIQPSSPDSSSLEQVKKYLGDDRWISVDHPEIAVEASLDEFYGDLNQANPIHEALLAGHLLPVWDNSFAVTGILRAEEWVESNQSSTVSSREAKTAPEKDWDRSPFSLSEQLKIILIVNDALPMRLTEDESPHRFDLKEAARIAGWDRDHVEYLTKVVLEHQFLGAGDDRYYVTERYSEWENDSFSLSPLATGLTLTDGEDGNVTTNVDLSFGNLLRSILEQLAELESGISLDEFVAGFRSHPSVQNQVLAGTIDPEDPLARTRDLIDRSLDLLYWLGLCDRADENKNLYRINERGRKVAGGTRLESSAEEELPLILQPDGQLMLPLECPLETFLHVNPFGLMAKVDRMIVYQIDDKSLVQALNKGWDAAGFREFLSENVRELPNPMKELFDDILEDVEDVSIEEVHHLLEFDKGATAAKAMNVLNNYKPKRINETTVVLRSETSEETIYRNLSRGGIRLKTRSEQGAASPILDR
ncbi:MAG: hypothetical protein ABEK50_18325 [bacterium]